MKHMLTAPEDIEKLAARLSKAKHPVVLTEGAGQEIETYEALVALCEKFALPVVEKPGALFANFPKDHPLYQGTDIKSFWNDMIVDDAVIRQAMEFAASALKLKPDGVPDISKVRDWSYARVATEK